MKTTAALLAPIAFFVLVSCGSKGSDQSRADSTIENFKEEKPALMVPDTSAMKEKYTCVEILTSEGPLVVALFDVTPRHRDNFIKQVRSGFYEDILFHRVINKFMIQAGDPASKNPRQGNFGAIEPGSTQPREFVDTLYHYRGALAAARIPNEQNPDKESSISQFYIISGAPQSENDLKMIFRNSAQRMVFDNPDDPSYRFRAESYSKKQDQAALNVLMQEIEAAASPIADSLYSTMNPRTKQIYRTWGGYPALDNEYTIFGFLISGYDVLDRIQNVPTTKGTDRPIADIKILSARVLAKGKG